MEFLLIVLAAIAFGYTAGILQKGININITNGPKPLVPKHGEEPVYNPDSTHLLPPEMQEYFLKNNGQMK